MKKKLFQLRKSNFSWIPGWMILFGASANTPGHRRKVDFKPCVDPEVGVQRKRDYPEFSGLRSAKFRLRSKPPRSAERHREIIQHQETPEINSEEKQAAENERRPALKRADGKHVYGCGNSRERSKKIIIRGRVDYRQKTTKTEDVQLISTWTEFQGFGRMDGSLLDLSAEEMQSDRCFPPSV